MSKKKNQDAAVPCPFASCGCEFHPCEHSNSAFAEAQEMVDALMAPQEEPPVSPSAIVGAEPMTMKHWAEQKGHIPNIPLAVAFPGEAIHSKPHLAVVLAYSKLASNSLVSESEYDRLVEAAYSIPIG